MLVYLLDGFSVIAVRASLYMMHVEVVMRIGDDGEGQGGAKDADVSKDDVDGGEVEYEYAEHKSRCHKARDEYSIARKYPKTDDQFGPTPSSEEYPIGRIISYECRKIAKPRLRIDEC